MSLFHSIQVAKAHNTAFPRGMPVVNSDVFFLHFALLPTILYVAWLLRRSPNNGWIQNDFTRRKKWDEQMKKFVLSCNESKNVVVWAGDLNVAPMDCDLSHPEYFRRQVRRTQPGQPRESSPSVENIGQPGCTSAERERLIEILRVGGLADLYRCKKAPKNGHDSLESAFSWRGSSDGKYYGKGMRIDHFFGSASLIASVESVANLGRGMDRKGFLGSDHCPVLLTFKPGHSK